MNHTILIQTVLAALKLDVPPKNPSDCEIRCYSMHKKGPKRTKCLEECEEEAAVAALAAKLNVELFKSFAEIIWEGGDIDATGLCRLSRQYAVDHGRQCEQE